MKKITTLVCLLAFLALGVGCNSNSSADTTASDSSSAMTKTTTDTTSSMASTPAATAKDTSMAKDRDFLMEAASGGMMEVELGKVAEMNASSPKVKEFGKMMVTDHTKANTELKAVAKTKNVTIPAAMMDKHQKKVDDLKAKKGTDFDKAYIDMMDDDHKQDISDFEKEASDGNDADVKAFAAKTLPVLKSHLDHVKMVKDGMKKM